MTLHLVLRCLLTALNVVYLFFGGLTLLMGVYLLVVKVRILRRYMDVAFDPGVFFIVLGSVVFVLAALGCVGAMRENTRFLCVYGFLLSGVVVAAVLVCVLGYMWSSVSPLKRARVENLLRRAVIIYRDDPDMEDLLDTVQSSLHCCGVSSRGYLDWQYNAYFNCSIWNPSRERCGVPYSCCRDPGRLPNVMCGYGVTKAGKKTLRLVDRKIYTRGCLEALAEKARENAMMVSGLSVGTVIMLVVGIAGSWLLSHSIKAARRAETEANRRSAGRPSSTTSGV